MSPSRAGHEGGEGWRMGSGLGFGQGTVHVVRAGGGRELDAGSSGWMEEVSCWSTRLQDTVAAMLSEAIASLALWDHFFLSTLLLPLLFCLATVLLTIDTSPDRVRRNPCLYYLAKCNFLLVKFTCFGLAVLVDYFAYSRSVGHTGIRLTDQFFFTGESGWDEEESGLVKNREKYDWQVRLISSQRDLETEFRQSQIARLSSAILANDEVIRTLRADVQTGHWVVDNVKAEHAKRRAAADRARRFATVFRPLDSQRVRPRADSFNSSGSSCGPSSRFRLLPFPPPIVQAPVPTMQAPQPPSVQISQTVDREIEMCLDPRPALSLDTTLARLFSDLLLDSGSPMDVDSGSPMEVCTLSPVSPLDIDMLTPDSLSSGSLMDTLSLVSPLDVEMPDAELPVPDNLVVRVDNGNMENFDLSPWILDLPTVEPAPAALEQSVPAPAPDRSIPWFIPRFVPAPRIFLPAPAPEPEPAPQPAPEPAPEPATRPTLSRPSSSPLVPGKPQSPETTPMASSSRSATLLEVGSKGKAPAPATVPMAPAPKEPSARPLLVFGQPEPEISSKAKGKRKTAATDETEDLARQSTSNLAPFMTTPAGLPTRSAALPNDTRTWEGLDLMHAVSQLLRKATDFAVISFDEVDRDAVRRWLKLCEEEVEAGVERLNDLRGGNWKDQALSYAEADEWIRVKILQSFRRPLKGLDNGRINELLEATREFAAKLPGVCQIDLQEMRIPEAKGSTAEPLPLGLVALAAGFCQSSPRHLIKIPNGQLYFCTDYGLPLVSVEKMALKWWGIVAIVYGVVQLLITIRWMTSLVREVKKKWPGVRKDGCLWVLVLLGLFLFTFLWPLSPIFSFWCGQGQKCCGLDWRGLSKKIIGEKKDSESELENAEEGRGPGIINQEPAPQENLQVPPSYGEATATTESQEQAK
ncbi:hypothetical protein B0T17DRAFT_645893 [Bombardia bombarda]|uniref:Transmembrane protein n=1 Tax=Bombardia bombarda TaxID=252184 RepID=A0AA40BWC6_9PEZI|nr:hypothetical protein B0T17DRAFT_645893 [Bombardia bombarda]